MELKNRKRVIFFVRIGLILAVVMFVANWIGGKKDKVVNGIARGSGVSGISSAPDPAKLAPGDVQIISTDGNIDATLHGSQILVGLAPAKVAEVREKLAKEMANDKQSGLGGVIANAVKSGVSSAIDTHVSFSLANIRDIYHESGQIVIVTQDGEKHDLKGSVQSDQGKKPVEFSREDAEKLVAAVKARQKELGL